MCSHAYVCIATINLEGRDIGNPDTHFFRPDVFCLQGITRANFMNVSHKFKSEGYGYHTPTPSPPKEEWEVIYSKIPISKKNYTLFTRTNQERSVTSCTISLGSKYVVIGTSHLEASGEGATFRKAQIIEIPNILHTNTTILCIDSCIPEYQKIDGPQGFLDAWMETGSAINKSTQPLTSDRLDRIWYSPTMECIEFSLISLTDSDDERKGILACFSCGI